MAAFLEFLSSNELTIVICLMVIIFILIMSIIIIDIFARHNNDSKKQINPLSEKEDLEATNIKINNEGLGMIADENVIKNIDISSMNKNLEKKDEIEEIKYVEEDEELEKTKALLELETLKKELAKMEQEKNVDTKAIEQTKEIIEPHQPVEKVIDVNQDNIAPILDETTSKNESKTIEDEVNEFFDAQEEHAIISVDELAEASKNITDEEIAEYEDDGNEPISLKELEEMYKSVEEPSEQEPISTVVNEEKVTLPDFDIKIKPAVEVYDDKNFKNTPVISPVYGLKPTESSIMLEQTANLDKLNEEIRKTNEFLSALKELRKNLE